MALTPVDGYADIAAALYGDGAWEIVKAKTLTPAQQQAKRERTQAKVGLASNVVGLGAGIAGTASALRDDRFGPKKNPHGGRLAHGIYNAAKKIPEPISGRTGKVGAALAGGALGLQVANIAGDAVANRVLSRGAKDKPKKLKPITKGFFKKKEAKDRPKAKLVRVGLAAGTAAGIAATEQAKKEIGKDVDFVIKGEISKSNDKRQVFGWASVVELNGEPIVDLQGDYMAIDVIEKAAYDYVHSSRRGGDMHQVGSHASDLIESFIVTPEKKAQLNLPDEMPVGWWVGFQVNDDKVWEMVKDGKRPEFSIHGSGQRVDVEI
jgi:hypothetical protein